MKYTLSHDLSALLCVCCPLHPNYRTILYYKWGYLFVQYRYLDWCTVILRDCLLYQ
jgi:hypothetical protein